MILPIYPVAAPEVGSDAICSERRSLSTPHRRVRSLDAVGAARRVDLVANKAMARQLATLFWRMMIKDLDFVETGVARYEATVLETKYRNGALAGSPIRPANSP
jgi:hypothetical protein